MNAIDYARELIAFDSTSYRSNADVSDYVESALVKLGFELERVNYVDDDGVEKVNLIGRKGKGGGGLAYFGHTDVVPAGDWRTGIPGPFEPDVREGRLYGRGSTDMKGSIACMLAAIDQCSTLELRRPIYFSATADEEVNHGGAEAIVQKAGLYQELITGGACGIVGEPTELQVVYAHKGGCRFTATSRGRAAHSSTRDGVNANLAMIPFLVEMKKIRDETESESRWRNAEFEPDTICFNIGINDYTYATNITPPQSVCTVGFRPMPGMQAEEIVDRASELAETLKLEFRVDALHPAFRTEPDSDFVRTAVQITGDRPPKTVGFGTEASNLRGLEQLIVLGPGSIAQAHTHDEWISLEQLEKGTEVYRQLILQACR